VNYPELVSGLTCALPILFNNKFGILQIAGYVLIIIQQINPVRRNPITKDEECYYYTIVVFIINCNSPKKRSAATNNAGSI
jgi:hypothetical protein